MEYEIPKGPFVYVTGMAPNLLLGRLCTFFNRDPREIAIAGQKCMEKGTTVNCCDDPSCIIAAIEVLVTPKVVKPEWLPGNLACYLKERKEYEPDKMGPFFEECGYFKK